MTTSSSETGSLLNAHGIYKVFGIFGIVLLFNYQCSFCFAAHSSSFDIISCFVFTVKHFFKLFYFQVFVLLSSNFDIVSYLSVNVNKFFYFFNLFQKLENLQSGERGI